MKKTRFKVGHKPWNKGIGSVKKECKTCSKTFLVQKNRNLNNRGKFCSWYCRWGYKKEYSLNPDMAELIGVIIGDGCINKYWNSNQYRIFISGNPIEDKDYMENYLPELIKKCIGKEIKPFMGKNGAYILQFTGKSFCEFLFKFGIKENKSKTVRIPEEIKVNDELLKYCIKGISDTDFTIIFTKKHTNKNFYPRISAQFASENLVRDLEFSLRKFGFTLNTKYNRGVKDRRGYNWIVNTINLDGPNNLKKWMYHIGFSNLRILSRIMLWKLKGYLQPKSNLSERLIEIKTLTRGVV